MSVRPTSVSVWVIVYGPLVESFVIDESTEMYHRGPGARRPITLILYLYSVELGRIRERVEVHARIVFGTFHSGLLVESFQIDENRDRNHNASSRFVVLHVAVNMHCNLDATCCTT